MSILPGLPPGALHWGHPLAFLLLILIPLPFWLARRLRRGRGGLRYPNLDVARDLARRPGQRWRHLVAVLRAAALVCLVLALARPQGEQRRSVREAQGVDIVLALDLSNSMRATDLAPTRLAVAKQLLEQFIRSRPADRIGLVAFSGAAFTLAPLTTDHESLIENLRELVPGRIAIDGTAIGDGILMSVLRLTESGEIRPSGAAGRVIILATDGANNRGADPRLAAGAAAEKGVRLHIIGLGSRERVRRIEADEDGRARAVTDVYGQAVYWEQLDEPLLRHLAGTGRGRYFRAATRPELASILAEIDRLETHPVRIRNSVSYEELYAWPLLLALALLLIERALARTRFRRLA